MAPFWSNIVYEKEVIFDEFEFVTSDLELEVSKSSIWKHTTSCDKFFSSFIIISQLQRPIRWAEIFTGLLFYVYFEIHQVRRLVFENYQ